MRIAAALAALLLLATPAPPSLHRPPTPAGEPVVRFAPVPLFGADPERRRLGRLVYLGGWVLTSNHPRFGGVSALHVAEGRATALIDRGIVAEFPLPAQGGSVPLRIQALPRGPDLPGALLGRDSEAMAVAGNRAWIAFERSNELWRYTLPDWTNGAGVQPPAMRGWRENGGSEAMLRLPDGRFLVFSERTPAPGGGNEVLLFDSDPVGGDAAAARRLRYRPPPGFVLTDAARLPDGRILFLNRRLSLLRFVASITIGTLPELVPGAVLSGEEIARFEPPALHDNLEAIAVARENGRDTIWVASDDNYSLLQRTLLLKFALAP